MQYKSYLKTALYQQVAVLSDEFCNFISFDLFIKYNTIRFTCLYVSLSSAASSP